MADNAEAPETTEENESDYTQMLSKSAESTSKNKPAQKAWEPLKEKAKFIEALALGHTARQTRLDKPSFVGRKFVGIFILFLFYSFVLFYQMSVDTSVPSIVNWIMNLLVLDRNPYLFGAALTIDFLLLSFLFSNEHILNFVFASKTALKQTILIVVSFAGCYGLAFLAQQTNFDLYSVMLVFAMLWLILQSLQIYMFSRETATKVESRWISHYSPIRYLIAIIVPYIILGVLLFVVWVYRFYMVELSLDVFGGITPSDALDVYTLQMQVVMPMLYVGLILIFTFMIVQAILTRRISETRRAGAFDNFTYSLIVITLFIYAIYNITLYLFLNQSTIDAVKSIVGYTSAGNSFFIVEFIFSMIFLIWMILSIHNQVQGGFLFFTKDGLFMFMIGTVLAQTTARLGIANNLITSAVSSIDQYLIYDHVMIPIFIIIFLGITIIVYYFRPQETSMFMHISRATVDKEDRSMETCLKFLKREFIRRGEKFCINDVIPQLRQLTALPNSVVWSLVRRLNDRYMDVQLTEEIDEMGKKLVYLDFIPITERYQGDKNAETRANTYMRERFTSLIGARQRKKITLSKKNLSSSKQSDLFVQALSVQYGRKIKDEESIKKSRESEQLVIDQTIDTDTKDLIYDLVKKEYMRRINSPSEFPEIRFKISDIAGMVEEATRVSPGRLYPLLKDMAAENWNFTLSAEKDEKASGNDYLIEFVPIDDYEIYNALETNRPDQLKVIRRIMQTWFERNIRFRGKRMEKLPLEEYAETDQEEARSFYSKWFMQTMKYCAKHFNDRESVRNYLNRWDKLKKSIESLKKKEITLENTPEDTSESPSEEVQ